MVEGEHMKLDKIKKLPKNCTIFLLAPTKKSAVELIMMAIEEHLDGEVE